MRFQPPIVRMRCNSCGASWDAWIDDKGDPEDLRDMNCGTVGCDRFGYAADEIKKFYEDEENVRPSVDDHVRERYVAECLTKKGLNEHQALAIATTPGVDWHRVEAALERGCAPEMAVDIFT